MVSQIATPSIYIIKGLLLYNVFKSLSLRENMGYIYIATNPGLKPGLIKIGITNLEPDERMKSLSKSTSSPANFELEYSKKIQKVKLIESRVHSKLSSYRFRLNKEFFEIDINTAIQIIERVSELTKYESKIATEIGHHRDLIYSHYLPKLKLTELNLMYLIMAQTNNMLIRNIIQLENDIVDGFLQSKTVSEQLNISNSWATTIMKSFCLKAINLNVKFIKHDSQIYKGEIKIFNEINYYHGELSWILNKEFIPLFTNNKI
jgi:hypothetical protein